MSTTTNHPMRLAVAVEDDLREIRGLLELQACAFLGVVEGPCRPDDDLVLAGFTRTKDAILSALQRIESAIDAQADGGAQ